MRISHRIGLLAVAMIVMLMASDMLYPWSLAALISASLIAAIAWVSLFYGGNSCK